MAAAAPPPRPSRRLANANRLKYIADGLRNLATVLLAGALVAPVLAGRPLDLREFAAIGAAFLLAALGLMLTPER